MRPRTGRWIAYLRSIGPRWNTLGLSTWGRRMRTGRASSRVFAATSNSSPRESSDVAETVDRVDVLGALLRVAHTEPLLRRQAEHADLALVHVAVHVVRRL